MFEPRDPGRTRREFLRTLAVTPFVLAPPALIGLTRKSTGTIGPARLVPTPACDDDDEPTIAQTEGPFFKPRSPERRTLLESGLGGTKLVVAGFVLTRSCRPVANALLDFWQADDGGAYDNQGFRLRGHQFADAKGAFRLETIVPGLYTGRTRHIHVKVQAPRERPLTTQLYMPGESANARDGLFRPALLLRNVTNGATVEGGFEFILDLP
jgi:protocatechuate 3,4-dioxygenase beta subunit